MGAILAKCTELLLQSENKLSDTDLLITMNTDALALLGHTMFLPIAASTRCYQASFEQGLWKPMCFPSPCDNAAVWGRSTNEAQQHPSIEQDQSSYCSRTIRPNEIFSPELVKQTTKGGGLFCTKAPSGNTIPPDNASRTGRTHSRRTTRRTNN